MYPQRTCETCNAQHDKIEIIQNLYDFAYLQLMSETTSESHRVRTLIPYLDYGKLKNSGILPQKAMFTQVKIGGNFPPISKKMDPSIFGLYVDHFIREILTSKDSIQIDEKFLSNLLNNLYKSYDIGENVILKVMFSSSIIHFQNIAKFAQENIESDNLIIEPELSCNSIQNKSHNILGHPDIMTADTIWDIKMTGRFNAMRTDTIHQLLSYYCLTKLLGMDNIKYIGVILPAQNLALRHDISSWKWQPFWAELCGCIGEKDKNTDCDPMRQILLITMLASRVGSHIPKKSTICATLKTFPNDRPCQIYLSGRTMAKFNITDADVDKTRNLVTAENRRVYVHSPHTFNVSRKYEDNWVAKSLEKHLEISGRMGFKGVVVHCGKKAEMRTVQAAKNMMDCCIDAVQSTKIDCPLLIETCAGEKGDFLSSPKNLIKFYNCIPEEYKELIKICVDTCHVFAAGYMPMDYIRELVNADVPIGLIHFNDSKKPFDSHVDRHAHIGAGYIGVDHLYEVAEYAITNNIDMVME